MKLIARLALASFIVGTAVTVASPAQAGPVCRKVENGVVITFPCPVPDYENDCEGTKRRSDCNLPPAAPPPAAAPDTRGAPPPPPAPAAPPAPRRVTQPKTEWTPPPVVMPEYINPTPSMVIIDENGVATPQSSIGNAHRFAV